MAQGTVAISAQVITATALIASGTSLSAIINCTYGRLCRIAMPSAWDAANLTFQTSFDESSFSNLYDSSGTEYTVTASASREIIISLADFIGTRFLKIRSGTSGSAVNQSADRTLNLVMLP